MGVHASVAVAGPDSVRAIVASSLLTDLPAGTYTIAASPVTTTGARFVATPATQTVVVAEGARSIASAITYTVATAWLRVNIFAQPGGARGIVSLTGPGGFAQTLTDTTTSVLLEPGVYTLTGSDAQAAGKTYRPDPAIQSVTLAASTSPRHVNVYYGAGSGSLDVTVAGLPAGTDAAITIMSPLFLTRRVTSSTTLRNLEAGSYTIYAATVGSSLTTHVPSPVSQVSDVTVGGTTSAVVSYGSAPLQLGLQLVAGGAALPAPVFLTAPAGDTRLFIVERNGRIRIVRNDTLLATPYLDIQSRVNFAGERGMLSMAFDPNHASNGRFYVYYVDLAGGIALERFASTPGSHVAGASDGIVMSFPHGGSEHHGGLIEFGPDGMLYLAPGDGGCCGDPFDRAQNKESLLGKLLRIDVTSLPYTIPLDNPDLGFDDARPEIWALGLRNPWRFSFDAPAGMLYVSDVGDDDREEVNAVAANAAGLNYGWRLMEGSVCFNPIANCNPGASLTLPALEYTHAEGCSVIGGNVYRGSAIPELTGHYLYSDYCGGWLRSFRVTPGGVTDQRSWPGIAVTKTVSFGRDGVGELYMIADGKIWRIVRQ